jgi:hypothetical protein
VLPPSAGAAIAVVAANDATDIKVTIDQPKLHYEFVIGTDAAKVENGKVTVSNLVSTTVAAPVALDCKIGTLPCAQTPVNLDAFQTATIVLEADVPLPGTYTAVVSILGAGARLDRHLLVTRTLGTVPVKVLSAAKIQDTTGTATIRVQLQNDAGVAQKLNVPRLHSFVRADEGKDPVQAKYGTVTSKMGRTKLGPTWTLAAGDTPPMEVTIADLDEPGHYTGQLRFALPDGRHVDHPLSIDVRQSMISAALWIALGVILSQVLRGLAKVRPWAVHHQTAAGIASDLDALARDFRPDDREKPVFDAVSSRLAALIRELESGTTPKNAEATLQLLDARVRLLRKWLAGRRATANLSPGVLGAIRKTLDDAADAIRKDALTAEEAAKAEGDLDGLDAQIRKAIEDELTKRIAELRTALQGASVFTSPAAIQRTAGIASLLGKAEASITAGQVDTATTQLGEARELYADALASELRARVSQPMPPGFTQPEWDATRAEVERMLTSAAADLSRKVELVRNAVASFLLACGKALAKVATEFETIVKADVNVSTPELLASIAAVIAAATETMTSAAAGRIDEASAKYREATEEWTKARAEAKKKGMHMSADATAAPAQGVAAETLEELPVWIAAMLIPRLSRAPRGQGFWQSILLGIDGVILVAAIILAIYLGLELLYLDDMTWGSPKDVLVAVLWGLGMHQVSGSAFEGVAKLKEKFL